MDSKISNRKVYEKFWEPSKVYFNTTGPGNRWIFNLIDEIIDETDRESIKNIIDIGCGQGAKTYFLKTRFPSSNVLGVDLAQSGIDVANKNYEEVDFKCLEADDQTIWNMTYDLISCFEVLEHLDDWRFFLDKIIANSSKYILLSFPVGRMRSYELDIGHVRNFKVGEVEKYLGNNSYKSVKIYYAGFPFFNPIIRNAAQLVYSFDISKKMFNEKIQEESKPTLISKLYSNVFYFLFKYCSTKQKYGEQFLGLFEKN